MADIKSKTLNEDSDYKFVKESILQAHDVDGDDKNQQFREDFFEWILDSSWEDNDEYFYDMAKYIRFFDERLGEKFFEHVAYTDKEYRLLYFNAPDGPDNAKQHLGPNEVIWEFIYNHECLHQLWDTFAVEEKLEKDGHKVDGYVMNIASDCIINHYLRDIRKKKAPGFGIYPEVLKNSYGVEYNYKLDTQYTLYLKLIEHAEELHNDPKLQQEIDDLDKKLKPKSVQTGGGGGGGGPQQKHSDDYKRGWTDGIKDAVEKKVDPLTAKPKPVKGDYEKGYNDAIAQIKKGLEEGIQLSDDPNGGGQNGDLPQIPWETPPQQSNGGGSDSQPSQSNQDASDAQDSADKAEQAAQEAQDAADDAKEKAKEAQSNGDSDANQKAQNAKNAQDAANRAKKAAQRAKDAAQKSKDAEANGDPGGEKSASQEAGAAQETAEQAAQEAKDAAKGGGDSGKDMPDNPQDLANRAQKAADKAKEAAQKAKEAAKGAKSSGGADGKERAEAAKEAERAAKEAQEAADEAKAAANKAQSASKGSDEYNKAMKEAEIATIKAEDAAAKAERRKDDAEGKKTPQSKTSNPGKSQGGKGASRNLSNIRHVETQADLEKIKKEIENVQRIYSNKITDDFGHFIQQCKQSAKLNPSGLGVSAPKAARGWDEKVYTNVMAFVKNKVFQHQRQYQYTYSRVKRGSGYIKFGEPIQPGRKIKEELLTVNVGIYVDISGSMCGDPIENAWKSMYIIGEGLKKQFGKEKVIDDITFKVYGWDTDFHPTDYGKKLNANGGTMSFQELLDGIQKRTGDFLINIILTDGQFSDINEGQIKKFLKDMKGKTMVNYICNSETYLVKKIANEKEYSNTLYYNLANADFSLSNNMKNKK